MSAKNFITHENIYKKNIFIFATMVKNHLLNINSPASKKDVFMRIIKSTPLSSFCNFNIFSPQKIDIEKIQHFIAIQPGETMQ